MPWDSMTFRRANMLAAASSMALVKAQEPWSTGPSFFGSGWKNAFLVALMEHYYGLKNRHPS
jgi:hypothetical protein